MVDVDTGGGCGTGFGAQAASGVITGGKFIFLGKML